MSEAPKQVGLDQLAVQRQLKIKANAVRRLHKEHKLYRNEAEEQQRKVDRTIAENGEEWDIKNARRMLEESRRMIQDTADRLRKAVQELKALIDSVQSRSEFSEDQELLAAEKEFTEASVALDNLS